MHIPIYMHIYTYIDTHIDGVVGGGGDNKQADVPRLLRVSGKSLYYLCNFITSLQFFFQN